MYSCKKSDLSNGGVIKVIPFRFAFNPKCIYSIFLFQDFITPISKSVYFIYVCTEICFHRSVRVQFPGGSAALAALTISSHPRDEMK